MSELAIIRDGALLAENGRVTHVGTEKELRNRIGPDWEVVDAGGRAVLPGFVDAHTHLVFAGSRVDEFERRSRGETYQQIAAGGGGILSTVASTRAASEAELLEQGRRHLDWMMRCGTTAAEAKSGYGLSLESELRILRTIRALHAAGPVRLAATFLGAHGTPPEFAGRTEDYAAHLVEAMLPAVVAEKLAVYADVFCEPRYFTVSQSRKIMLAARRLGLGLRLHADQLSSSGGAQLAAELGAVTADHLELVDAGGIAALAGAGVQPVLLPGSVYALGLAHYPPARAMIDAGLAVVLATDFNPGSSPTPSIPMVMSLAATHLKMSPAEAITATTVNAAQSLGWLGELGTFEPGKRADFVIHDCADHRELAYYFGLESAAEVFIGGRRCFRRT
ncbi:MAG: imidazolonepropionase [Verrucomicrobia bacterium]|nr:imidazolonepropionase [Verrucomicrobiota bacterium]